MLPCVLFEDEHLLVVNKPAGVNTHAPSPWSGEGIFEWLRDREPRWGSLAIIHRLDKETSGVLVFGLTPEANRSLTTQFSGREVAKRYLLLTDRAQTKIPGLCRSCIQRAGDKYLSRPVHAGGELAETEFKLANPGQWDQLQPGPKPKLPEGTQLIEAVPLTGRTHQIRVHAAGAGFPVLGDTLYGGTPAARVFLHAAEITLRHPVSGLPLKFKAAFHLDGDPRQELRDLVIEPGLNTAYRLVHGAADGWPDLYVDRLGDYLLAQSSQSIAGRQAELLEQLRERHRAAGVYHRLLTKHARGRGAEASPVPLFGAKAPPSFSIVENGLSYELSLQEGYSVGLFLDQRENRRRLLAGHIGARFAALPGRRQDEPVELLNAFAYTCGFSVAAAKRGVKTTSLDLSKKYLEWGKRNFHLNGLDPADHDFIFGDVFDWLKRLRRKGRLFDIIILDPPTFSQSKESGVFRAESDYAGLVAGAVGLLKRPGILLASTNAARLDAGEFVREVLDAARQGGRKVLFERFTPQPLDFPISRAEPGYLKTFWLALE